MVIVTIVPGNDNVSLLNRSLPGRISYNSLSEIKVKNPLFNFRNSNKVLKPRPPGAYAVFVEFPGIIAHFNVFSGISILWSHKYSLTFSKIVFPNL